MQTWIPIEPIPIATALVLGLSFGSFLEVVIYRLPRGLSLAGPRSRCDACGHPVRARHNIPVWGWLALRGRCADCGARIPGRVPLIEAAGGGLALLAACAFPTPAASVAAALFLFALLAVLFIDLEHRIIPDGISIGGTAAGLALSHWTIGLGPAVLGAGVGAAGLYLVRLLYKGLRGIEGMGLGDVKLAAMIGAFLGAGGIVLSVLLASFLGTCIGLLLIALGKARRDSALPFGSMLAPAAAVALLWGPVLLSWYARLFR